MRGGWAVVGTGVVSPAGLGRDAFWHACFEGPIAPRPVDHFDAAGIEDHLVGLIPDLPGIAPRGSAARWADLAIAAGREALAEAAEAGSRGEGWRSRTALVLASTDHTGFEIDHESAESGAAVCSPRAVAAALDLGGPVFMVSNASAAGAAALVAAARLLDAGAADSVLVVGVDCITRTGLYGLAALRALSREGCRPFSARRRGIHMAECAAALVLDRTGPSAFATLSGAWVSNLAGQHARPEVAGVADAVAHACAIAGIAPHDLDHVNAHAAGTVQGDLAEMTALEELLGPGLRDIPVLSVKAVLGHCQGAAGVIEAIATVRTVREGKPPVLPGVEEVDERWSGQNFGQRPASGPLRNAVSISCGLGGANAALVFTAPTESGGAYA